MSIFDNNLEFLRRKFNHVYTVLQQYVKQSSETYNLEVDTTKNNLPNIRVATKTNKVYLHSNYDPYREAEAILNNHSFESKDTVVIFGLGMGYHVEEIIKRFPKLNKIIFEPDLEIFNCVVQNKNITQILRANNTELFVESNPERAIAELACLYQTGRIHNIEFLSLPSYGRLFPGFQDEVMHQYSKFFRLYACNVNTMLYFLKDWIYNFFSNLKHVPFSSDLGDLAGQLRGVPAIMVSAGPSLKKNIHLLREIDDRALIVANGSTVSVMQQEGIKPHMMVGIDGSDKMAEIYQDVKWNDPIFAYVLSLHRDTLDDYSGPKLYVKSSGEGNVRWMEEYLEHLTPEVSSGGSCAIVALDVVKKLGCNPIIMIGQDLAFTGEKFYAEGHFNENNVTFNKFNPEALIKTKDIYGEDIYTGNHFLVMSYGFENYIARRSVGDVFINATEGGLPIKGTEVMSLREAIDAYCREDMGVKRVINELVAKSTEGNTNLRVGLIEFTKDVKAKALELGKLSKKRMDLVEKILEEIESNNLQVTPKMSKKLLRITEEIEASDLYKRFVVNRAEEVLLAIKNSSEAQANKVSSTQEKARILYGGLRTQFKLADDVNRCIIEVSDEALERLEGEV